MNTIFVTRLFHISVSTLTVSFPSLITLPVTAAYRSTKVVIQGFRYHLTADERL